MTKGSSVAILATSCFVSLSFWVAKISLDGLQALQDNYSITVTSQSIMDIDRDGIPDTQDDSDGDGIPDQHDATPYGHDVDIFSIRVRTN